MSRTFVEPHWLSIGRKYLGTKEIPGPKSNPTIMAWAKRLGSRILGIAYTDESIAWCGLYAAQVIAEAGFNPPKIAVRASAWDAFGVPVTKLYLGCLVRFERPAGGHIGFLTGVSADGRLMRVLGGNQSDSCNETWIERSRCVAMRWPSGVPLPTILAPVVSASGAVSKNEA